MTTSHKSDQIIADRYTPPRPASQQHIIRASVDHKPENAGDLRSLGVDVPYGEDYRRRKTMPADLDAAVVAAGRKSGITTPLFRKTSCGVAYAHGVPDYNVVRSR